MSVVVSACLFLSATGCAPAERRAGRSRERIAPGMTADQVRDEIGEPTQITRGDPGQPQAWIYQYDSGAGTVATIILIVLVVGLIVILLAAGGGAGFHFDGLGGGGEVAEFQVHFDGTEKVVEIGPIVVFPRR